MSTTFLTLLCEENKMPQNSEGAFVPPKISGYRQLSAAEIALMNEAKAIEATFLAHVEKVRKHIDERRRGASDEEFERLYEAEPERWVVMARTDMQVACMKLCRAVRS